MRLIALGNALYWIVASLVVLGGFVIFVATMVKQIWTNAVERRAESIREVYHFDTRVDIYNFFFGPVSDPVRPTTLPNSKDAPLKELEAGVGAEALKSILTVLLRPDRNDAEIAPEDLAGTWSVQELSAALELCGRGSEADMSPGMKARCRAAVGLLEAALEIERKRP